MFNNTKSWLANYYSISESQVENFFNHSDISGFLIIWTVFEKYLFGTEFKNSHVHSYEICNKDILTNLEDEFIYFHDVYQDDRRYKNLIGKGSSKDNKEDIRITAIRDKPVNEIEYKEKLTMLLYITFRYRNNIFHGSKGASSWLNYSTEINCCMNIMKALIEEKAVR